MTRAKALGDLQDGPVVAGPELTVAEWRIVAASVLDRAISLEQVDAMPRPEAGLQLARAKWAREVHAKLAALVRSVEKERAA